MIEPDIVSVVGTRTVRVGLLVALLATVAAAPAMALPIYTFNSIPDLTITPFSDTSDGVTATFSSSPNGSFSVDDSFFNSLTGNILFDQDFNAGGVLNVSLSAPFGAFSVLFALNDPANLTQFQVQAFSGGVGGTVVGTLAVTGSIPPGFAFPEGFATIDFGLLSFDALRFTSTAPDFAIDDLALRTPAAAVPEPATMTLLCLGLAGMGAGRWRQRRKA